MAFTSDPTGRAVEQIYREHSSFVWRMAKLRGLPEHAIPDLLQEVFATVLEKYPCYREEGRVRGWIYRIADGHILMYFRREGRTRRRMDAYASAHDIHLEPRREPDDHIFRDESARLVTRFMNSLSSESREEFFLCCIEETSVREAADILRLNTNTLYSRVAVLRRRFADFVLQHHSHAGQGHA